jgi:hypothetical protein
MAGDRQLSRKAVQAAEEFLTALRKRFPDLADKAYYRRGEEDTVSVCFDVPPDQEATIVERVWKALAPVSVQLLTRYGELVLVVRKKPWEKPPKVRQQRIKGRSDRSDDTRLARRSRSGGAANRRT